MNDTAISTEDLESLWDNEPLCMAILDDSGKCPNKASVRLKLICDACGFVGWGFYCSPRCEALIFRGDARCGCGEWFKRAEYM